MFRENLKTTAQEIFLLMEKTHARMGLAGELKKDFLGAIFEAICIYEIDVLKEAMSEFEQIPSSRMRSFPRLGDIVEKVKEIHAKRNVAVISSKYECEYHDEKESVYSKSLCKHEVIWADMLTSKEIFDGIYCLHHQKRIDAIKNPNLERSIKFINDMREGEKIRIKSESMPVGFDDFGNKLEWIEFHRKYVIDGSPIENFYESVKNGKFKSLRQNLSNIGTVYAPERPTIEPQELKNSFAYDSKDVGNRPLKQLFEPSG